MSKASEQFLALLGAARERLVDTRLTDTALTYCIAGIARLEEALRRPLRVVILGEYNSGKTSVADLLIGSGLLPTSVVSNTNMPVLMTYAETAAIHGITQTGTRIRVDGDESDPLTDLSFRALQVALPLERLRSYQILDTPPSAAPAAFVDDADIVIWCTVATRAWTESERALWSTLPARCCRNALLVATHKDSLQSAEDIENVTKRLQSLTKGFFRDVILVAAESAPEGSSDGADTEDEIESGAKALRDSVEGLAFDIADRRTQKAEKIVRRLARLTFHHLQSNQIRAEAAPVLADWESRSNVILEQLAIGIRTPQMAIEDLLHAYAFYAEKLRPGVITGDSVPAASSSSRALTQPVRWPSHNSAAQRLVTMLASDLTALLRMLAGNAASLDPRYNDYQVARRIVLALADLDSAFAALARMLGSQSAEANA
jgi:hypothetical protein